MWNSNAHTSVNINIYLQSVEVKPLNTMKNHPEWVVHDEIPLTTASITKYKAGTSEQWYYIIH